MNAEGTAGWANAPVCFLFLVVALENGCVNDLPSDPTLSWSSVAADPLAEVEVATDYAGDY